MEDAIEPAERLDFDQATARFVEWFTAADGTRLSPKVQLKDLRSEGAGRGAIAVEDVEEDEELFAIPRSLVLTVTTSSIPPALLEPLSETGAWQPLIVTIIYEYLRKEKSPWHAYFQVLPTKFDSLMFWNAAELDTLQASAVVDKISRSQAEESWKETMIPVMLSHPELFPVPGQSDSARTAELIKLAHIAGSSIMAYAFDIDKDGDKEDASNDSDDEFEEDDEDEPLKGMVPLADMLNADADKNNVRCLLFIRLHYGKLTWVFIQARLFQENDYLIMRSTKQIRAGEQIFNDYGPLPRSDLLRMYGYITDNYAQYDVVEISHDLLLEVAGKKHAKDATWLNRAQQLEEIGIIDDGYAIPRPAAEAGKLEKAIPGQIHMLLRALCTEAIKTPKDTVTIKEAALLQSALTKRLSEYGTSLEADRSVLELLARSEPGNSLIPSGCDEHRYAMALQVRIGEKEILHQLIGLCQAHIAHKNQEITAVSTKRQSSDDSDNKPKKAARKDNTRG
ncbi:uncharacterized protein Z519_09004 [Cladophialophora bantiana CBS 173.52]|uniref:Ribosomal lysine N-methyltransferase 4 n=1 Tax=Cladophialophora bantiana (strain ATCC 10958 / CBS 173.52 / CDC B-1940 / NIH 8579) TaxID=1442370 RepID=A0A0D2I0G9_CLAB1|nr:uncharacterized protein Z519_09004 [Cladophialophora bantiana CBS 173.52]KIW90359.1 hypothetical protein Z519_09004 [Cladophialophora bantiana CBS 173.52]